MEVTKNQEEQYEENKEIYFLSSKINIETSLENILFFNRSLKASEAELSNDYNLAIKYDNVTEKYIYEYLTLNANKLDFLELQNKTLALGLSKDHFDELKIKIEYSDFKEMFFKYIDLLQNDIFKEDETTIKQSLIYLYSNGELLLNQPLSFQNNKNLMYYSLLNYLLPSSKDQMEGMKNIITRMNNSYILDQYLRKMETLTDVQIWNIIFYMISITEENFVLDLKEKLQEKNQENNFSIFKNSEEIKCEIKNEILYGYKDNNEIIRIPQINIFDIQLIKNLLAIKPIKINNPNEIYEDLNLLKCIKIEYLNEHNYYTPHLKSLKIIIKEILTSKAIDEYIDKFTDHNSSINPFKNEKYYDLLWEKYVHFVVFQKEEFQAETFRIYHKVFLNALPIIYFLLDKRLLRLFNYSLFIVICIHEFLGHLEKMIIYYVYKNIKVKTEEFIDIEFEDDFFDNLDEEMNFLKSEFKNENAISLINENINQNGKENENSKKQDLLWQLMGFALEINNNNAIDILKKYKEENKKEYLIEFKNIISSNKNNISQQTLNKVMKTIANLYTKEKSFKDDSKEGGFILENILFGSEIFADIKHSSINKSLFILNSNNYTSIKNLRNVSTMFMSYRFAKNNNRDYINFSNYSVELKNILSSLGITEDFLVAQDKILFSKMYGDLLLDAIKGKKYEFKSQTNKKSCIPSHY